MKCQRCGCSSYDVTPHEVVRLNFMQSALLRLCDPCSIALDNAPFVDEACVESDRLEARRFAAIYAGNVELADQCAVAEAKYGRECFHRVYEWLAIKPNTVKE